MKINIGGSREQRLAEEIVKLEQKIEQLEAALQRLSKLDEFLNGEPSCVEEVMNYTQSIARAALAGEKKDD